MSHYDVIIVGAGPIGLTLGIALGHNGYSVLLVDQIDPTHFSNKNKDGRTTAIAYAGHNLYTAVHVWPDLAPLATAINKIYVRDGMNGTPLLFNAPAHPMGFIVRNYDLRQHLLQHVQRQATVDFLAPAQVTSFNADAHFAYLNLADGNVLKAKLCIACDGRHSMMRQQAGLTAPSWSYSQQSIVSIIDHELPHNNAAFEYFLPTGPLALLPMAGNQSSLVWSCEQSIATYLYDTDDATFNACLQESFGPQLGTLKLGARRWCYPLTAHIAQCYISKRFALVGDAAHGVHPVAGQGLNMGLRDIAAMVDALNAHRSRGLDIGSQFALENYQRWRRFDNLSLMGMTDGMVRLFSNNNPFLKFVRRAGLKAVNHLPLAKSFFMTHAMGLSGHLPTLTQTQDS